MAMLRLKLSWSEVGDMTLGEAMKCLKVEEEIRKVDNQELYHVIFVANANARGGDKNGRPLKLYAKEKRTLTAEDIKKEKELLGI